MARLHPSEAAKIPSEYGHPSTSWTTLAPRLTTCFFHNTSFTFQQRLSPEMTYSTIIQTLKKLRLETLPASVSSSPLGFSSVDVFIYSQDHNLNNQLL